MSALIIDGASVETKQSFDVIDLKIRFAISRDFYEVEKLGGALHGMALEETLTCDPIRRPDDGARSPADVLHHPRSDGFVVLRELELRDGLAPGRRRPERLLGI